MYLSFFLSLVYSRRTYSVVLNAFKGLFFFHHTPTYFRYAWFDNNMIFFKRNFLLTLFLSLIIASFLTGSVIIKSRKDNEHVTFPTLLIPPRNWIQTFYKTVRQNKYEKPVAIYKFIFQFVILFLHRIVSWDVKDGGF